MQALAAKRGSAQTQVLSKQPASREFQPINGPLEQAERVRTSSVAPALQYTPDHDYQSIMQQDDVSGGSPSTLLNSAKRHMIAIQKSNKRSYKAEDETERDIA